MWDISKNVFICIISFKRGSVLYDLHLLTDIYVLGSVCLHDVDADLTAAPGPRPHLLPPQGVVEEDEEGDNDPEEDDDLQGYKSVLHPA